MAVIDEEEDSVVRLPGAAAAAGGIMDEGDDDIGGAGACAAIGDGDGNPSILVASHPPPAMPISVPGIVMLGKGASEDEAGG